MTEKAWEDAIQGLGNRESKLHVHGKQQIQVENLLKIENEQIKTAQNNSYNSNFRKLGHVVQILVSRLTLVNMMLNISDVHTSLDSFLY